MAFNYDDPALKAAGFLVKGESARDGIRRRKKSKAELLQDAYDEVDRLDKLTCWVTGRTLRKGSVDARNRLERHHSYGRRAHPEKRHDVNFIFSVAAEVHEALTLGKLEQEGLDRRKPVFFHYNCPPAQRHFEILPRRLRKVKAA